VRHLVTASGDAGLSAVTVRRLGALGPADARVRNHAGAIEMEIVDAQRAEITTMRQPLATG
jgi:hypothetical protein